MRRREFITGLGSAAAAALPPIAAPTIVLSGGGDGVSSPARAANQARFFTNSSFQHRVIPVVGHDIPQEAPAAFAEAILELIAAQPGGGRRAG